MWFFGRTKLKEQEAQKQLAEMKDKAIKEATVILTKGITEAFEMLDKRSVQRFDDLKSLLRHKDPLPPNKPIAEVRKPDIAEGDDISVYAFYFTYRHQFTPQFTQIANDKMLSVVLAKDEPEAMQKAEQVMRNAGYTPSDWEMKLSNQLPILIKGKKPSDIQKERPLDTYITNLMYAREKFTETPYEKGLLTKIINKIQKQHVAGPNSQ